MVPYDPSTVVRRRWLRCAILQAIVSSLLWIAWGSRISSFSLWPPVSPFPRLLPSLHGIARYLFFQASQIVFLLALMPVMQPEEEDSVTIGGIFFGFLRIAWRVIAGAPLQRSLTDEILFQKLHATMLRILFSVSCVIAGFFAAVSLPCKLRSSQQGAALGLVFAAVHIYRRRTILKFPIIQRHPFFSFKLGLPAVARTAVKLSAASLPFMFLVVITDSFQNLMGQKAFLVDIAVIFQNALFTTLCWELCYHVVQVVHTRRHSFSPLMGTSAAETFPNHLILTVFEDANKSSLVYYLAILDILMVAENNVDSWRRAALFEESGDTYQRVVAECLRPLDILTLNLTRVMGGSLNEDEKDIMREQMVAVRGQVRSITQIFKDFQLCSWCARIVGALTAASKNQDRYGVAQLKGCNAAVLSSLLSCLLVIEVSLGRRSSMRSFDLIGPNNIKWTIPSRGVLKDLERRQEFPFKKNSHLYKKAYAMADIICTSVYQIVAAFRFDMLLSRVGSKDTSLAERDWLGNNKPLYGTREMHLQKLNLFLEFKMS